MSDLRSLQKQIAKLNATVAKAAGETKAPTFKEFALQYQAIKLARTDLRESTKKAFEYQLRRNLIPAFGHLPIDQLSSRDWNVWIQDTQAQERKQLTRYFNARKCITEVMLRAYDDGIIDRKPKFENPDETKNVGRVLEDREVWLLLRNMTHRLFRLFFYTMAKMGCRPREILRWEWSMITWGDNPRKAWIDIPARITKTGRTRKIPLNGSVARQLHRIYNSPTHDEKYVFPNRVRRGQPQLSYHGAWKTALKKAGIPHCVPYDFRRTFITRAMAANKPGVYVAKLLDTSMKQIEGTYAKAQQEVMEDIVS